MLLHSFFTGTSTVFFETAASALFLARYDATLLPFVYLAAAAVSIFTGLAYARTKERVRFAPLMRGTLALMLGMICLTRLGLGLGEAGWLVFSMMIAYRLLSSLTDLEYWAVAARLYDVQQSKRLFGLVGSGEVVARILGSFSVPILVPLLGVENLIWLSAAGLASALAILTLILRRFAEIESRDDEDDRAAAGGTAMRSLFESRYLKAIFLLAVCAVLGKYFVDFAFLSEMQSRWREVDSLASFFGLFSGVTQVINLLVRVLVSGRLLARFGILVGLLVLPAAHIAATLGVVAASSIPLPIAVFWLVISNQGLYKTLNHPVYNPSFKVLYQPMPRRDRLAAQIFVEVILTPIAIAFAAALMIAFSHPALAATAAFAILMLVNFTAWCGAAFFAFREYGTALVRALQKRTLDRTSFSLEDEQSVNLVRARLESERADEVIFALDILQRIDHPSLAIHFGELLSHPSPDVRFYVSLQIDHSFARFRGRAGRGARPIAARPGGGAASSRRARRSEPPGARLSGPPRPRSGARRPHRPPPLSQPGARGEGAGPSSRSRAIADPGGSDPRCTRAGRVLASRSGDPRRPSRRRRLRGAPRRAPGGGKEWRESASIAHHRSSRGTPLP
jgi:hypothetical protein